MIIDLHSYLDHIIILSLTSAIINLPLCHQQTTSNTTTSLRKKITLLQNQFIFLNTIRRTFRKKILKSHADCLINIFNLKIFNIKYNLVHSCGVIK